MEQTYVVDYLGWHFEERGPATELFHDLHGFDNDVPNLTTTEFDDLYREVRELEDQPEDLEQLWREWNRGSGYESDEFREMRYCEPCDTYQVGGDEAIQHAAQNHGYDPFVETGEPDYIRGIRSMSVGDVVEVGTDYFMAAPIGWEELEVTGGGPE